MSKQCPICKQETVVKVDGMGWDWDREWCMSKGCDYDVELDTMTGVDPDGSTWVMKKEDIKDGEDE